MGAVRWQVFDEDDEPIVKEIRKVVVHRSWMGTTGDPNLHVAQKFLEWELSEQGQFVMKHAIGKPDYHINLDQLTYEYECVIVAELEMKKLSEFYLKWGPSEK